MFRRLRYKLCCPAIGLLVLATLAGGPATAQNPPPTITSQGIPDDAIGVIILHPNAASEDPSMRMLPWEVFQATGLETIGVDPLAIEQIKLVIGPFGPAGVLAGAKIQFKDAVSIEDLNQEMVITDSPAKIANRDAFPIVRTPDWYVTQVDAKNIMVGSKAYLPSIERADGKSGALAGVVSKLQTPELAVALVAIDPIRDLLQGALNAGMDQAPPNTPDEILSLVAIPELLDFVMIRMVKGANPSLQLTMVSPDDTAAESLQGLIADAIEAGKDMLIDDMASSAPADATAQAMIAYAKRISPEITALLTPKRDGRRLVLNLDNSMGGTGTIAVLTGLLLPAVQAAREAARRMESSNNLKQIALAMHNHESAYRKFPEPAIADADGKPLLSWRVKILPFIEQMHLYEQFHLDEPWDSEHNLALLDQMPDIYRHPKSLAEPGHTVYQIITGEEIGFDSEGPTRFQMMTDGTSNTLMCVEVQDEFAVPWTKPEDVEIDRENPGAKLGGHAAGGFNAAFFDGSVQFISESIDAEMLWALMTRGGGEVIRLP